MNFNAVAHQLAQMHQNNTPIAQFEHAFNSVAQPLLQIPQYQPELQRLYVNSINSDLRNAVHGRPFNSLYELQHEIRMLDRKFASIDAYRTLYTLRQGNSPIAHHNYRIDSLLALLEVPMADDLLQDMYRKSLRPDVQAALPGRDYPTFADLRRAVARICP